MINCILFERALLLLRIFFVLNINEKSSLKIKTDSTYDFFKEFRIISEIILIIRFAAKVTFLIINLKNNWAAFYFC